MTIQNYLLINTSIDPAICENICVWDGNVETWNPGENYIALPLANTISMEWSWDYSTNTWIMIDSPGQGKIGYIWNGEKLVTNLPSPTSNTIIEIKDF